MKTSTSEEINGDTFEEDSTAVTRSPKNTESRLRSTSMTEQSEHPKKMKRHLSFDPPLTMDHHDEREKEKHDRKESEQKTETEQDIIDRYYDKNHFTITGLYEKNQETLSRLPYHMDRKHRTSPVGDDCQSRRNQDAITLRPPKKFHKTLYWLAQTQRMLLLHHLFLIFLVLAYTLLGAAIFYAIESRNERLTVTQRKANLDDTLQQIAQEMTTTINDPLQFVNETDIEHYLRSAYIKLLSLESAYKGSTLHKAEDPENHYKWSFGSAFFFAMNVYTTTGYGSIAPETIEGKTIVMFYGFIFVPLTLVVIRDLGQQTLVVLTRVYAQIVIRLRTARGLNTDNSDEESETFSLPIIFCMALFAFYLMFCTLVIYEYDALSGPAGTGIDFFHALYFSFISLSTIGLGDIMPNNVTFAPLITIMFFSGMPILKVVNRSTYISFEKAVYATMLLWEQKLEKLRNGPKPVTEREMELHTAREPSLRSRAISVGKRSVFDNESSDEEIDMERNQMLNNMTIRSIATFMKSDADVYGGRFGKVTLRRNDLGKALGSAGSNQDTVSSKRSRQIQQTQQQQQQQSTQSNSKDV